MLYPQLTENIIRAFYKVYNLLGFGFLEKVYENAMYIELTKMGYKVEKQRCIKVFYENNIVGEYYADIVVESQVIIELKAVDSLQNIHQAQLLNYLKATGYKIGLLVNFTHPKAQIKRFVL